jgi:beta-phosphoglucomutase-like phosphatase (HAD superfamily)
VETASYLRGRAKHYLELARLMDNPIAVSFLRAAADRDLARAVAVEKRATSTQELESRVGFSDNFYYRAIRADLAERLRSRPAPTVPPPDRILAALQALDCPPGEDQDEEKEDAPSFAEPRGT